MSLSRYHIVYAVQYTKSNVYKTIKRIAIRNVLNEAKVMLNYDSYDENMVEI